MTAEVTAGRDQICPIARVHSVPLRRSWQKCAAFGILGMSVPACYGGADADILSTMLTMEGLWVRMSLRCTTSKAPDQTRLPRLLITFPTMPERVVAPTLLPMNLMNCFTVLGLMFISSAISRVLSP